jgi:tetratricopeptide (TPR) repeat protein
MDETQYPAYVYQMLAQAQALLAEDDFTSPDAAAICFDVLALFPDCQEASNLVMEAFSDPWLIRDYRKALSRLIDEWDDRSWQRRRRLALSFRYASRWEGQYREYDEALDPEDFCPSDVKPMLEEGRGQLLQDYLLGEGRGSEAAWPIFQEAIKRTNNPRAAMLWVADLYADQGFFAESSEVLGQLLAQFPDDQETRRLWVEVCWWRDNQAKIPWIPPLDGGNGRRWRKLMREMDDDFAANEEAYTRPLDYMPPDAANLPPDFDLPPPIQADLIARVEEALANLESEPSPKGPVDWSFLDKLEIGAIDDIDTEQFPTWARHLLAQIDDPEYKRFLIQHLLGYLSNPPIDDDD